MKNRNLISYNWSRCEKIATTNVIHCQHLDNFSFKYSPFVACPYMLLPKFMNTSKVCARCRRGKDSSFKRSLGTIWICQGCESKTLHLVTEHYLLPITIKCDKISFDNSIGICWQCTKCKSIIVSELALNNIDVTFYCPFC